MNAYIGVVAALVIVGAMLFYRASSAKDARDEAVLEQLRAAGSDLAKPHALEFYVYVATENSAKSAAAALARAGFQVQVRPAAMGPGWLALASKTLVPTSAALAGIRRLLTKVASIEGGEYDGWEAQVTK